MAAEKVAEGAARVVKERAVGEATGEAASEAIAVAAVAAKAESRVRATLAAFLEVGQEAAVQRTQLEQLRSLASQKALMAGASSARKLAMLCLR